MDLTPILLAANSGDTAAISNAQQQLVALEAASYPSYLLSLVTEMGTETKPQPARQLAGLLIKNTLVAKDDNTRKELAARWHKLDTPVKQRIKGMLFQILASPVKEIRSTAALAIASIATIEIPRNEWPDLIQSLVANIANNRDVNLRQSSFECLGYICEEEDNAPSLQQHSNMILTAIARGMHAEERSVDIRYAATSALANSLVFVEQNMAQEKERTEIMNMVFSAAMSETERVRVAALQCLVTIASTYYQYLEPFMQVIFNLTTNAIQNEKEDVTLQAIEFWSTLSDCEIVFKEEAMDDPQHHDPNLNKHYVTAALPLLVPRLLETLTKQSEDVDDETWNPAQAAATCLSLIAEAAGDPVVPVVLPFITQNIASANWRLKEAATIAFGCILDGPKEVIVRDLVVKAFPFILENMRDANELVKDTASWTIGRICHLHPETTTDLLDKLIAAFMAGLNDVPSVASNVCWAIHNLANALPADDESNNALTKYFTDLLKVLVAVTQRPDTDKHKLLPGAYEAINALISTASVESYPIIQQLIPVLLTQLGSTMTSNALSPSDRERQNEVQALLCGACQTIIQKLDESVVLTHSDSFMMLFIRVLSSKNATVHEEALMAIGALANRVHEQFEKYLNSLTPFLFTGLRNEKEYKVCTVAVGLVGDISRAVDAKFIPLSDDVMKVLLQHLESSTIERSVKPHIISCLGDIALAVGGFFVRYLPFVFRILIPASKLQFVKTEYNWDDLEYLDQLRESILESWTGILQGVSADSQQDAFLQPIQLEGSPHPIYPLEHILAFFDLIAQDEQCGEPVIRAACGLIGDLCSTCGVRVKANIATRSVERLIQAGLMQETEQSTKQQAKWAKEEFFKLTRTA